MHAACMQTNLPHVASTAIEHGRRRRAGGGPPVTIRVDNGYACPEWTGYRGLGPSYHGLERDFTMSPPTPPWTPHNSPTVVAPVDRCTHIHTHIYINIICWPAISRLLISLHSRISKGANRGSSCQRSKLDEPIFQAYTIRIRQREAN